MFKRNLLKRTLPILLSVAMTFQSVPITAMAAEDLPTAVVTEAEDSESAAETSEEAVSETSEDVAGETTEPAEETQDSSEQVSEQPEENVTGGGSGEGSAPEESTDAVSDSEKVEDGQENPGSEAEAETKQETINKAEADVEAELTESVDGAAKAAVEPTEITVTSNLSLSGSIYVEGQWYSYSFTRQQGESGHAYTKEYTDRLSKELDDAKNKVVNTNTQILVNGNSNTGDLKDTYLTVEWQKINNDGKRESMAETPKDAGSYALHLAIEAQDGLCGKAEYDVYFNITPKELTLSGFETNATPGSKVKDFVDAVKESCTLSGLDKVQYSVDAVEVYKLGAEKPVPEDSYFNKYEDYSFKVKVTLVDSVKDNYKLDDETEFRITFGGFLQTRVDVTLKKPGEEIAKKYDGKEWKLTDIAGLVQSADVKVWSGTENDYVPFGGKAEEGPNAADPRLYTKETNRNEYGDEAIGDFPASEDDIDKDTQLFIDGALYTAVPKDENGGVSISDVGDYYLIYVSKEKEGVFEQGNSEPVKVTIDPVEVILKPVKESIGTLTVAMDEWDVARVLAGVEAKLYTPDSANETKAGADANAPTDAEDFYGVSYDDKGKLQYYTPVFELQRREKSKRPSEDKKENEWSEPYRVTTLEADNDDYTYEYYVVFTGKKAVYRADGKLELENGEPKLTDITETSTDSANRNYKVKTDEETLKNLANAEKVDLGEYDETKVKIDKIVDGLNAAGDINHPVRSVYTPGSALFKDRESYKKADVEGKFNPKTEDLKYTWQYLADNADVREYEKFIHMDEPAKTDENHSTWESKKEDLEGAFSTYSSADGYDLDIPEDAGVYRLRIDYKDSELNPKNAPSHNEVYFVIEKQELMFVADTQYAEYDVDDAKPYYGHGYSIYKVDGNDESKFDRSSAKQYDWDAKGLEQWKVMNLKKNADGSDSSEWEESEGKFKAVYQYKAAVALKDDNVSEGIKEKDTGADAAENGRKLNWKNYTTRNYKDWDAENEKYRYLAKSFAPILFGSKKIELTVSGTVPGDRPYNGHPIADKNPLTVTTSVKDLAADESQDAVKGVEIRWRWTDTEGKVSIKNNVVTTAEAVYGGTYTLVATFKGTEGPDGYKAIVGTSDEWQDVVDKDGNFYQFTIKPLEVEIVPELKNPATAGQAMSTMLEGFRVEDGKIPDVDKPLFVKGPGTIVDAFTGKVISVEGEGYPILASISDGKYVGGTFGTAYYENNSRVDTPPKTTLIRFGRTYDVKSSGGILFNQYALSYKLSYKSARLENIERGEAEVEGTTFFNDSSDYNNDCSVAVHTEVSPEGTYEIKPLEGIPFVYKDICTWSYNTDLITNENIPYDKNYIAVKIKAPREFSRESADFAKKNFVYGNSIKKDAGGYVIYESFRSGGSEMGPQPYIIALFPVERDEDGNIDKPVKTFYITWEKGKKGEKDYTETFTLNLKDAKLEANLKEAVAPKSIAFNALVSKMAVGEEQQLDVKITKMQLGDVILVNYRLADGDEDYAYVDTETGRITALGLKDGKQTTVSVEAYPVRLAADGKTFEEINNDKPVKKAAAKITITDVTAPAIKKVVSKDASVEVQYTKVNDGYRREIYVVELNDENKNSWKTAKDFNDAIDKMKNGQWKGTFAIAPKYVYGPEEYDPDLKLCKTTLSGLKASSSYVVYVRNVSAARTLADGISKVTKSAAGSVKTFNTTKSMVQDLELYFDLDDQKNTVQLIDKENPGKGYIVNLTDKNAQLKVYGWFWEKALPSHQAADDDDQIRFTLPLKALKDKELTDTYAEPKLSYYITDCVNPQFDAKGKIKNASKYATISNSGKITLKGVGENGCEKVRLWVFADKENDKNWNRIWKSCDLIISAQPDDLTVKKVKPIKVGDGIRLADYLEYKEGGKKVPNYWSSNIKFKDLEQIKEQGFEISQVEYGKWYPSVDSKLNLKVGEYIITAVKPGVTNFKLEFTDMLWADGRLSPQTKAIELSTAQMDAVKSLKAAYTDDKHITLNFADAGHPEAYDIEVRDARDSLVFKKLIYRKDASTIWTAWLDDEPWLQNKQNGIVDGFTYFEKTKVYAYTISTEKLMRLSSYTVTVDPVYNGMSASGISGKKAASAKAKTTNIPASYGNADIMDPDWQYVAYYDEYGMRYGDDDAIAIQDAYGNTAGPYFISGNTYTLITNVNNPAAHDRGTDTLTWKSSNTKVISLKANQGSYSATLKAMQQGKATITVTSKITKKTIARYHVAVKAVGNGSSFGGDFEWSGNSYDSQTPFYDKFIQTYDPYYEGRLEVLTVSNPVTVGEDDLLNNPWIDDPYSYDTAIDRTWVQFTAPAYGEYTFDCTGGYDCKVYYAKYEKDQGKGKDYNNREKLRLEEGQKIYFKVSGTFTLKVSEYTDFTKLTMDKPLRVTKDTWVSFTAPEDNYYTFSDWFECEKNGSEVYLDSDNSIGMKAGETLFIYVNEGTEISVEKRDLTRELKVGSDVKLKFTKDAEGNITPGHYFVKFKAENTGDYSFEYPDDKVKRLEYYGVDSDTRYYDGGAVLARAALPDKLFIVKGETIAIKVLVNEAAFTGETKEVEAAIKVTSTAVIPLVGEKTVTKNKSQIFEYTIPEDKDATKYTVKVTEGASVAWYKTDYSPIDNITGFVVKDGNVIEVNGGTYSLPFEAGEKIYIEVEAPADKDVKFSIEKTDTATEWKLPVDTKITLNNDYAKWYVFNVTKPGYYEFNTSVPAESKHNIEVQLVTKAFADDLRYYNYKYLDINSGSSSTAKLNLGIGSFVLKISADPNGEAVKDAKTEAALSIKEVTAETLSVGDKEVKLSKKGEAKYYSFETDAKAPYLIKWVPDAKTGEANATYNMSGLEYSFTDPIPENGLNTSFWSGDSYYIRVEQTADKAVSGKLQVIDPMTRESLVSGKEKSFELKAGDKPIEYTFTTPEKSPLGYVVTVENTSKSKVPTIAVSIDSGSYSSTLSQGQKESVERADSDWTQAYKTRTITISAEGTSAAAGAAPAVNATGKITVEPITPADLATAFAKPVKFGKNESRWYTYTITGESGRYLITEVESAAVSWYKKNDSTKADSPISKDVPYLEKGQQFYVNVSTGSSIADAGVNVKVEAPAAVSAAELPKLANGKTEKDVKGTESKPEYYTFTAPAYADYTVSTGRITKFLPPSSWTFNTNWTLEKDEKILIKVTSTGKLTVTQAVANELKADAKNPNKLVSGETTLKTGETADFTVKLYKAGYYDFRLSSPAGLKMSCYDGTVVYNNDNYFIINVNNVGSRYKFTVTNTGKADAKFTVTAEEVVPVKRTLDKEVSVPVEKGRMSLIQFTVPETYRYMFTSSKGSKLVGIVNNGIDTVLYADEPYVGILEYIGEAASGTATVKASMVEAEVITNGTTISLGTGETKWYMYTATETGRYEFTVADGVDVNLYESLSEVGQITSPVIMKTGSEIYLQVTNDSADENAEKKLTVTNVGWDTLEVDDYKYIETDPDSEEYLAFTSPEDGFYTFSVRNGYGNLTYYGDSLEDEVNAVRYLEGNTYRFFVEADDTVYLGASNFDGYIYTEQFRDISVYARVDTEYNQEAEFLNPYYDPVSGTECYETWYAFEAPYDGKYSFEIFKNYDMPALKLYQSGETSTMSGGISSGDYYYAEGSFNYGTYGIHDFELETGQRVYLRVYMNYDPGPYGISFSGN